MDDTCTVDDEENERLEKKAKPKAKVCLFFQNILLYYLYIKTCENRITKDWGGKILF